MFADSPDRQLPFPYRVCTRPLSYPEWSDSLSRLKDSRARSFFWTFRVFCEFVSVQGMVLNEQCRETERAIDGYF